MYFIEERIKKLCDELKQYIHSNGENISNYKMKSGNFKGGEHIGLDISDWQEFGCQDRWGGRDYHCWFRTEVKIPPEFHGKTVTFEVKTGREGQWDATNPQFIIYINGKLIQGLDVNHTEIVLTENAVGEEIYTIALHAYSGMQEGLIELNSKVAILNRDVEKLYYNIKVPLEVAGLLDKEDKKSIDILNYLNETVNKIDFRKPLSESFISSILEANEYIENEFYNKYCGNEDVVAVCVGHTHIDVAWLWTLAQTREKTTRSFSTVLNLMKQYPEYVFMSSQPQLYKFLKEEQPELYKEVKERIKEGRWEAEGAMWLEADCNIASGEALVRQVLFGTRFFKQEFGVDNKILWLPDVFGYSAALPQILKKSGIDYFMTTKIGWNEYNKMPYDTFSWRGIDGTEILTHFITARTYSKTGCYGNASTYNGIIGGSQVMGAWASYSQKAVSNEVLIAYGYGDGGGGPTKEMLENSRRLEKGIPGCPKVKLGKALDYFKDMEMNVLGNKKFPKWVGELYLEYHRGTYTSMARNKKYNRKSELLYQDAEFLSVMGQLTGVQDNYPADSLNKGWETILLNQFHDILPGSSIKEVYEDSQKQYIEVIKNGNEIVNNSLNSIAARINIDTSSVIIFNPLGYVRSDIVELDLPKNFDLVQIYDNNENLQVSQVVKDGSSEKLIFFAKDIPAKGYKTFSIREKKDNSLHSQSMTIENNKIENKYFDIRFDENANISSIFDKLQDREVLKPGQKANVLQTFEDKPHDYDAWDINIYYQEKMWEINDVQSVEILEKGPVRAVLQVKRSYLDSIIIQNIVLYNDIPRIDFVNKIDWKESHILLKAAFPVDIHSDKATYDIQYGNVERPTHWNTSWDYARFEVCAHKWADISEDGYGVSLLNDCKYGYDIKDGNMRLTLLKSATYPNEDADREMHEFTYSLYPHSGDWKDADTVGMAHNLNCPMYTKIEKAHNGILPSDFSMIKVDKSNVIIEVVKKAEDTENIIIRLYECYNRRTKVELTTFKEILQVWECDLMENNISETEFKGNSFEFEINPYEIKTFKLKL